MSEKHIELATVAKFREIARAHHESRSRAEEHRQRIAEEEAIQSQLEFQAQQCHTTASLFGFDIFTLLALEDNGGGVSEPAPASFDVPLVPTWVGSKPPTVREFILQQAQDAYPRGVRARGLKEDFERLYGTDIHEKTMGMTLYRIANRDGSMRRDGWDWFYVPTELRGVNNQTQELPYDGS